jgi:hypothetical protein
VACSFVWVWDIVPRIKGRLYKMCLNYLNKYQEWFRHKKVEKLICCQTVFLGSAPTFAWLNPSGVYLWRDLRPYCIQLQYKMKRLITNAMWGPSNPSQTPRHLWKCEKFQDLMCPWVHWLIFWALRVNCNLANNKNWTVIGLRICTVNVMLVLSEILHS